MDWIKRVAGMLADWIKSVVTNPLAELWPWMVAAAAMIFFAPVHHATPTNVSAPLPQAKVVKYADTVEIHPAAVKALAPKVKAKLGLPAQVVNDDTKAVTATGTLKTDTRDYTMTSVLDVNTGDSEVYAQPEPLPWIAPSNRTEIGAFIGYHGTQPAIRVEARQELLRLKALHVGATANADFMPATGSVDGFVGIGAWAGL